MSETNGLNGHREEIHWPSLIAAISAISAVGIAIGLGLPLLSIILEKRGISSTLIGINSAMAGVAAMAAAPCTARLAHAWGTSTTMLGAILLAAISGLGFYYIENFWLWFPLRIVFHGATTMLFILSEFWINAAAPPRRRGLVLGIYATVLSLGFATGPLVFSLIGSEGVLPFALGAVIILTAAVPIFIARGESPTIDEKPELHFMRYILLVPTATAAVFIFGAVQVGGLSLLPIYATLDKMDETLIEAAADLGCPPWKGFWLVTLPLSLPGVIAGALLCFIPIIGEFVIPDLLGSSQSMMIGQTLWTEFFANKDWPVASAVAVVLLCLLVVPIVLYQSMQTRDLVRGP